MRTSHDYEDWSDHQQELLERLTDVVLEEIYLEFETDRRYQEYLDQAFATHPSSDLDGVLDEILECDDDHL